MYDWANSAFACTVMTVFFPIFFKQYWAAGSSVTDSTFYLGVSNSVASLCIVILAPILGTISDQGGTRKNFLVFFMFIGALSTLGLFWVHQGAWQIAAIVYTLGTLGFAGANTFYDSMIVSVSSKRHMDYVSAIGYSLGYLGGGLLLAINALMAMKPELFGLATKTEGVRWAILSVGVWWIVFTIPLIIFVKEPPVEKVRHGLKAIKMAFLQLWETFHHVRKIREMVLFLIAYWLYIDAVHSIIKMAVDFGLSIGLPSGDLIKAVLITQFVGFPSAIAFGFIGQKIGTKNGIYIAIFVYFCICICSYFITTGNHFMILAATLGLVQGGLQSLSRSFYARMVPVEKTAEFFGFYNMMGKSAAVLGPLIMGVAAKATGNVRLTMIPLSIMLLIGGLVLSRVKSNGK